MKNNFCLDEVLDWAEGKMLEHADNMNFGNVKAIAKEFEEWSRLTPETRVEIMYVRTR